MHSNKSHSTSDSSCWFYLKADVLLFFVLEVTEPMLFMLLKKCNHNWPHYILICSKLNKIYTNHQVMVIMSTFCSMNAKPNSSGLIDTELW